jgi:hypothetical protein
MLLIVSISAAVTFAAFIALQHAESRTDPQKAQSRTKSNIAVLFVVFLMSLIGLHYMGVGSGSVTIRGGGGGSSGRIDAYEDAMIKTIAEDCFVGNAPF